MKDVIEIATQVVTVASVCAFLLPPASKFDKTPRFQAVYGIFLQFVDWIAFNKRPWYPLPTSEKSVVIPKQTEGQ